jgi:hypothetical protein
LLFNTRYLLQMKDRINKLFLLTSASSLLIVLGVFLPFIQIKISIFFMGISNSQNVTVDYWNHGDGDGKYLLLIAIVSVVLAFFKKYKWLWLSMALNSGVIIWSIVDSAMNASAVAKGPYAEMAKSLMKNTKMSIIPREGLFLLVVGLVLITVVAFLGMKKPKYESSSIA